MVRGSSPLLRNSGTFHLTTGHTSYNKFSTRLTETSNVHPYPVKSHGDNHVDLVCIVCINEKQGCNQTTGSRRLEIETCEGLALSIYTPWKTRSGDTSSSKKGFTDRHTAKYLSSGRLALGFMRCVIRLSFTKTSLPITG